MDERLREAIASKALVTIDASPDGELRCHAKFIAADKGGIWIQCKHAPRGVMDALLSGGVAAEGSFCAEGAKFVFSTKVLKKKRDYWLTNTYAIEVWLLEYPETVTHLQRRAMPRYRVPDGGAIYAKLLRTDSERPKEAPKSMGRTMWDIGGGGVSFVMPMNRKLLGEKQESWQFVTVVSFKGKPFLLRCELVYTRELSPHTIRFGFRFMTAERQPAGSMELLQRLLKELDEIQRNRARRATLAA